MNMLKKFVLVVLVAGVTIDSSGQQVTDTIKLSIDEARIYALQHNRAVQAAKIDINIATKQVKETVAIGLPQLSLASNYTHQFVVPEISFGSYFDVDALPASGYLTKDDVVNAYKTAPPVPLGVPDNTTFDLTLSQLIFSGEYIVGLQALKVLKQISEKALVKTEEDTKESVSGTYFLILVLNESSNVLRASHKTMEKTYNDMLGLNQQGFNEDTDVDQIKISLSNLQRLITSVESQRETSLKLLKYQLGMDFSQPVSLTDSLPEFINTGNTKYLIAPVFNLEKNIDFQIINDQVEVSEILLKREKSAYFPTISGFYRRHEQTNQPSFNFAVKDVVGLNLNLPIVTSGQRSSRVGKAKFSLEKAQVNRDNAGQGLTLEFETALSKYQTAYSNYITNEESVLLSKKVYDKSLIKYREGVSTSFEVSQNQTQYLTAEGAYYNSILDLLNAMARLDRILESF